VATIVGGAERFTVKYPVSLQAYMSVATKVYTPLAVTELTVADSDVLENEPGPDHAYVLVPPPVVTVPESTRLLPGHTVVLPVVALEIAVMYDAVMAVLLLIRRVPVEPVAFQPYNLNVSVSPAHMCTVAVAL